MFDSDELDEIEMERVARRRERRKWEEKREMVPERDIEKRSKFTQMDRQSERIDFLQIHASQDKETNQNYIKERKKSINRIENKNQRDIYKERTKSTDSEAIDKTGRQSEKRDNRQRLKNISRESIDKERRKSMDSEQIENLERDRKEDTSRDRRESNSFKDISRRKSEDGGTNREKKKIGEEKTFQLSLKSGSNEAELLDAPTKNVAEKQASQVQEQKIEKDRSKDVAENEEKASMETMLPQASEKRKSFAQASIRQQTSQFESRQVISTVNNPVREQTRASNAVSRRGIGSLAPLNQFYRCFYLFSRLVLQRKITNHWTIHFSDNPQINMYFMY
jgi:hypothetical protein